MIEPRRPQVNMYRTFRKVWMCRFRATVCKTVRPMLSDRCLSVYLSVTLLHCGQTVGWIKMLLGTEVGFGPDHTVLDGDPAAPTKKGTAAPPHRFRGLRTQRSLTAANVCCGQTVGCTKTPLRTEEASAPTTLC